MDGRRILVAGCGDVGTALALRLRAEGAEVAGLRRRAELLPAGIEPLAADLGKPSTLRKALDREYTHVVVASAADGFDEAHYRRTYVDGLGNLLDALPGAPRVVLVSSTGVYHQQEGEWVDEDSPTEPSGFSGRILLEAERLARARLGERLTVLRLGGIYGPGRERLLADVRAGIGCERLPPRYTNRIHREDCAGALQFLLGGMTRGVPLAPLYLGVDDEPAPMWEVRHWLAQRLGVALDDTAPAPSARGPGSKRCSNRRLREAGYVFRYPDFRAGYAELLAGLNRAPP